MSVPLIDPPPIVSPITKIDPNVHLFKLPPEALAVTFANGETAILDPSDPNFPAYAAILAELMTLGIPVYVKVNLEKTIVTLLIPISGNVVALVRDEGGEVGFRLDSSAQAFTFDETLDGYHQYISVLQDAQLDQAPVLVIQSDTGSAILDIRRAGKPNPPILQRPGLVRSATPRHPVTQDRALCLFNLVGQHSCVPRTPASGCIPFLYMRDGCHVRAHEMCRLLIEAGEHPGKVWNYSNLLDVNTPNEPTCEATWSFHVAPTLHVTSERNETHIQVLDPSLFSEPVPTEIWRAAQGDLNSILLYTGPDPFLPPAAGDIEIDPDFTRTKQQLDIYRLQLQLRAIKLGPPPYCREKNVVADM